MTINNNIDEKNNLRVLFVGPHTDDIELGSGGTLVKFLEKKYQIMLLVFSTADDALPKDWPRDALKREFLNVVKALNIDNYKIFNFKVRQLNFKRQEILDALINIREEFNPQLVVSPSLHDFHQDHVTVANEVVRAFKTTASIICYELPWNHINFDMQLFVKLDKRHIDKKFEILQYYKSQLARKRKYFSKEFIYGLAKVRGVQCNSEFAEAFEVIRWMF